MLKVKTALGDQANTFLLHAIVLMAAAKLTHGWRLMGEQPQKQKRPGEIRDGRGGFAAPAAVRGVRGLGNTASRRGRVLS